MTQALWTRPAFRVTAPPTNDGWQVTYEVGAQHGGMVVTGVLINSATQTVTGYPRGGLTAQAARSLIRPGTARAELIKEPAKRRWRVEVAQDFASFLGRYVATPAPPRVDRRRLTREQRLASVAGVYVAARHAGAPNPRQVVAKAFGWSVSKARDEIHAARCARPPLLTAAGPRGNAGGGGLLTPAAEKVLEALRTQPGSKKPKG